MQERNIEQRIRTAVEHAAPDRLDSILSACGSQTANVIPMPAPKTNRRWAPLAVAAALALLLCGGFGVRGWLTANTVDSVVMLDVNPSLSLSVNARERVLDVTPLNKEAVVILGGMDLVGTDLEVAVNALIGSMLQNGFLSDLQNAILVSVENRDAARSAQLRQQLTDTINAVFQGGALEGAVLSQTVAEDADLAALADQYGISQGKAALIRDVTDQDATLTFASLAPLTVTEIALIAESRHLNAQSVTTTGSASDKAYIGAEAAKAAALRHAGVQESAAVKKKVELDSEDGLMVYEVEFKTALAEYEYDIDARTGAVVKFSIEGQDHAGNSHGGGASKGTTDGAGKSGGIGAERAKAIALADAGVQASRASGWKCELETDDSTESYEIEFQADGVEYEYDVRASDGTILKAKREEADDWEPASAMMAYIGEEAAAAAAFHHAGVDAADVLKLKCKLDEDDGTYRYEVEFHVGDAEYEYEIDAATGAVLKADWETDRETDMEDVWEEDD